jgi:hypothetical protein
MIEITIVGLKKLLITWIICPIVPSIFATSIKSVSSVMFSIIKNCQLSYCGFLTSQHLHIYPQKLKKKGYDYDKDQTTQT